MLKIYDLSKIIETIESELGIYFKERSLVIKKYYSDIYLLKAVNKKEYILKIGKTDRNAKSEYEFYLLLERVGLNSLKAIFFDEEMNALLTEKKEIKSISRVLRDPSFNYNDVLFEMGRFCKQVKERSVFKTSNDADFSFENSIVSRLSEDYLPIRLIDEIKSWLKKNKLKLKYEERWISLATDFNFYNIHIDSDNSMVLVDLGDAHFWPVQSNIAYLYLQFRFNCVTSAGMKKEDFKIALDGYGDEDDLRATAYKAFLIFHMLNMIDFYVTRSKNPTNFFSFAKCIYEKFFRIMPIRKEIINVINQDSLN